MPAEAPADLRTVVGKCLEKERSRRYATAAELAADLDRFLRGEPVSARPASLARRGGLAGAVAAAVVVVAGTTKRNPDE
jgi:hypothetical protein